jgi:amino acid transporter
MAAEAQPAKLDRALGLKEATALNMIDMVGVGPFVLIGDVVREMGGPHALLAWAAGAALAVMDGFIWAELGAAMPLAGGSYVFLRESYGPQRWGRLMAFLFIWQTMFQAPLVMASAAIGFVGYLGYLAPMNAGEQKMARAAVILFVVFLLYRRITTIGKISLLLWVGVLGTMLWLIWGGVTHFDPSLLRVPEGAFDWSWVFYAGLGAATVQTIYTYLGYYNVCHLGAEIRDPERNIPRSIFLSIGGIAVLYLLMQTGILGVEPWQEAQSSGFVASLFVERLYGAGAAKFATAMILWIAFGSLFALTVGYSRIPYAAALDGTFFSVFGRVHATKHFPHISLLALGATALAFVLLFDHLRDVIRAILAMRTLVQFIGGAIGLVLLHRVWKPKRFPYKMPLYPLPVVVVVVMWLGIFFSTGSFEMFGVRIYFSVAGVAVLLAGVAVFLARARILGEWPFKKSNRTGTADERR